ncbi:hypothetical protein KI387_003217, partial [Taxus chinensis]
MASALITFNSVAPSSRGSFLISNARSSVRTSQRILRITANPARNPLLRVCARQRLTSVRVATDSATITSESIKPAILLSENALKHLNKMRAEKNEDLCLRIGVRQGGCSGMSYVMDFEQRANARPDDSVVNYDGFTI